VRLNSVDYNPPELPDSLLFEVTETLLISSASHSEYASCGDVVSFDAFTSKVFGMGSSAAQSSTGSASVVRNTLVFTVTMQCCLISV